MAGKFVYTATGERIWVDDAKQGGTGYSGESRAPQGLTMGSPGAKNHTLATLPNYGSNLEHARLLWDDAGNQNQIKAAHSDAVTMNRDAELATREKQMALLAALQTQSAGGGPSVANSMTLEGKDAAMRAQMAGGKPGALGMSAALGGGAQMQAANAMKGGAMRAQEQQSAFGALNAAAGGVRGADMQAAIEQSKLNQANAMANAGFKQQTSVMNQNAQLAALGNRQAAAQQYGGLVSDAQGADMGYRGFLKDGSRIDRERKRKAEDLSQAKAATWMNTTMSAVGGVMSDERGKTDVEPGEGKIKSMLDALTAHEYRYKNPNAEGAAPGKHISVMAQDLEKTDLGKRAVTESDEGHKMVDYGRLAGTQLAATAMLHKRLNALEAKAKR